MVRQEERTRPRVVIVGGGYAGVRAARDLALRTHGALEIVVVSQDRFHVNIPALYEVATAYLPHESVASTETIAGGVHVPLQHLLAAWPVEIRQGKVKHLHLTDRHIVLDSGETISFTWLVLALGATLNRRGVPGVDEYAFSLRNMSEAVRLRHHIVRLSMCSEALHGRARTVARTFVIVGGGAAGVEAAAELTGLLRAIRRARGYDGEAWKIFLLEAGDTLLPEVSAAARAATLKRLVRVGVQVQLNARVSQVERDRVVLLDGHEIETETTIWNGGIAAQPLFVDSGLPVAGWGISVDEFLRVKGFPGVWVAGDSAAVDRTVPATVPVAYQEGALVAQNIVRTWRKERLRPYVYAPTIRFIALGGKHALMIFPSGRLLAGRLAWWIKELVFLRYWMLYLTPWAALWLWGRAMRVQSRNDFFTMK